MPSLPLQAGSVTVLETKQSLCPIVSALTKDHGFLSMAHSPLTPVLSNRLPVTCLLQLPSVSLPGLLQTKLATAILQDLLILASNSAVFLAPPATSPFLPPSLHNPLLPPSLLPSFSSFPSVCVHKSFGGVTSDAD